MKYPFGERRNSGGYGRRVCRFARIPGIGRRPWPPTDIPIEQGFFRSVFGAAYGSGPPPDFSTWTML